MRLAAIYFVIVFYLDINCYIMLHGLQAFLFGQCISHLIHFKSNYIIVLSKFIDDLFLQEPVNNLPVPF